MIWLDEQGNIVIRTDIKAKDLYEVVQMKKSVLGLLETQDPDFHHRDSNYWAYKLVELLEPEAEQICLKK